MRLKSLAAAIAALSSFSIASAFGDDWSESARQMFPPPCTPQAQRCLEKLSTLIDLDHHSSDSPHTGRGWRDLIETDPDCVIELGAGWIY